MRICVAVKRDIREGSLPPALRVPLAWAEGMRDLLHDSVDLAERARADGGLCSVAGRTIIR